MLILFVVVDLYEGKVLTGFVCVAGKFDIIRYDSRSFS